MDNLDIMATLDGKKLKWHSDSELNTSVDSNRAKASGVGPGTDNAGFGQTKKASKQKVFIPKEHLWSRANSLKKAMREIIDHTEKGKERFPLCIYLFKNSFRKFTFFTQCCLLHKTK